MVRYGGGESRACRFVCHTVTSRSEYLVVFMGWRDSMGRGWDSAGKGWQDHTGKGWPSNIELVG